jgi:hypothetical protein
MLKNVLFSVFITPTTLFEQNTYTASGNIIQRVVRVSSLEQYPTAVNRMPLYYTLENTYTILFKLVCFCNDLFWFSSLSQISNSCLKI